MEGLREEGGGWGRMQNVIIPRKKTGSIAIRVESIMFFFFFFFFSLVIKILFQGGGWHDENGKKCLQRKIKKEGEK